MARMLLPFDQSTEALLRRFSDAAAGYVQAGQTSKESVDLALKILRSVKLSDSLQRELQSLRESLAASETDAPVNDESDLIE
jgi:hypothetical protein